MFIGRDKELMILDKLIFKNQSSLVIVYGRRRIGKTKLIRHFAQKNNLQTLQITGTQNESLKNQIFNFTKALKRFSAKTTNETKPKNWNEAFANLEDCLEGFNGCEKKLIFLDEFPWLDSAKSGFLSAFSHFWNDYCENRNDLIIILCGSATSYMLNKLTNNTKTLNNRANTKLHLQQFDLKDSAKFILESGLKYSNKAIVELYMCFGGVAYYLENLEKNKHPHENIHQLCFNNNGLLKDEFEILYDSLFSNAQTHKKIINLLINKWSGYSQSEIIEKTKLSSSTINIPLQELENSGFITSFTKFGNRKKEKIYRATDCYSFFYNKWVKNNKGKNWVNLSNSASFNSSKGFFFENICLMHIDKIKTILGISGIDTNSHYWAYKPKNSTEKGVQIDILLEHCNNSKCIDIIECKFYKGEYEIDKKYYNELCQKIEIFNKETNFKYNIRVIFIVSEGVKKNQYYHDIVSRSITIDEIIA